MQRILFSMYLGLKASFPILSPGDWVQSVDRFSQALPRQKGQRIYTLDGLASSEGMSSYGHTARPGQPLAGLVLHPLCRIRLIDQNPVRAST